MRAATLWAACLPLNGHPIVLANPDAGADGELFACNLANCPLHVVNGGRDPALSGGVGGAAHRHVQDGRVPVEFQVYPEAGHDVSWWPEERPRYEAFLAAHPRVAHPESVSWETERDRSLQPLPLARDRSARRARPGDAPLADVNEFSPAPAGERAAVRARSRRRAGWTRPARATGST